MSAKLERLSQILRIVLDGRLRSLAQDRGEITIEVGAEDYLAVARTLRDHAELRFEQLADLCGVDYSAYGNGKAACEPGRRFATVLHMLSIEHNWRLRLKVFSIDDNFPVLDSVCDLWPSANWDEREAFDLFGIMYSGHTDLRRILTDYGFVGHPLRKDFPVSGYTEMRYDAETERVIYQPVTIEPRENAPRVVREAGYGDTGHV
ncbi:MAG: NADH-quinone oxidoreductase subunit C [Azoarcus sp.]|jgi:NADH-quinone oxidoreductase subunit C|nr:NADH-quinone oxidoreductase subunit C [Azoarcus sp.]